MIRQTETKENLLERLEAMTIHWNAITDGQDISFICDNLKQKGKGKASDVIKGLIHIFEMAQLVVACAPVPNSGYPEDVFVSMNPVIWRTSRLHQRLDDESKGIITSALGDDFNGFARDWRNYTRKYAPDEMAAMSAAVHRSAREGMVCRKRIDRTPAFIQPALLKLCGFTR